MTAPQTKSQPAPGPVASPATVQPVTTAPPPGAGGSYTCDPATGALTLATPSTIQE